MKSSLILLSLLCFIVVSGKSYWHRSRNSDPVAPEWDKLSVTWLKWEELPLTVRDAVDKGWTLQEKCQDNAYYRGNRYVRDGNITVMLLFDENNKIAGIQTGIAKSAFGAKKGLPWKEENGNYIITAYFKDPSLICSHRPSQAKYIGDRLLIQKSSTPYEFIHVPLLEDGLFESAWTEGECFWSMGKLYWYDLSNVADCDSVFPVFLMFTNGVLNGFGWVLPFKVDNPRFVHPTKESFPYLFKNATVPDCFRNTGYLSLMHVYLDSNPFFNIC